jgi:DNA-binding MarR family transcriptional regulator
MLHMSPRYRQLDLDVQLCFPLYATSRAVTRRYAELLAGAGLTYPQYLTMLALWGSSPLTVGEIGERLRLDSGTLTPLLKRLESARYVVRHRDPEDERRVIVEPTKQGWDLRGKIAQVPFELASSMDITPEEAALLRRLLGKILDNLVTRPAPVDHG